ncbi:MAG: Maf family nucleotide pyrophosphatase [Methyloligellaceae bacterium]
MTSPKAASLIATSNETGERRAPTLRAQRAQAKSAPGAARTRPKLVLASGSPRRLALLDQVGIKPDALRPATLDEAPASGEPPRALVVRLAQAKAEAARDQIANDDNLADAHVLAADTIVAVGRRVLVKPESVEQAVSSLQLLSGRSHRVLTCVHLLTPQDKLRRRVIETRVRFKRLSLEEIDSYIASREWRDKAGGYAIQGLAAAFVRKVNGSYTNVVGLPVSEVVQMLVGEGFPVFYNWLKLGEELQD